MAELFNIYCDESCHLEHDGISVMVLGAVWCRAMRARALGERVRDIKAKHKLAAGFEVKWTKVSPAKQTFYIDLVRYFFAEDDLHFRAVVIPDKAILDHAAFGQQHDDWYYKMMFTLIEPLIDPESQYRIYLDIKDTRSEEKRAKLQEVLRNKRRDADGRIIQRVQQIRSHESELLQITDLLAGAVAFHNRRRAGDLPRPDHTSSPAKANVVRWVQALSHKTLDTTTWLREAKFNILRWESKGRGS